MLLMSEFRNSLFSQTDHKFLVYFVFIEVESKVLIFVRMEDELIKASLIVVDLPLMSSLL
jgi:hypothetical protein